MSSLWFSANLIYFSCCHGIISAAEGSNYYYFFGVAQYEDDFDGQPMPGGIAPESSAANDDSLESGSLEPVTDVRMEFPETWLFEISTAGYFSILTLYLHAYDTPYLTLKGSYRV